MPPHKRPTSFQACETPLLSSSHLQHNSLPSVCVVKPTSSQTKQQSNAQPGPAHALFKLARRFHNLTAHRRSAHTGKSPARKRITPSHITPVHLHGCHDVLIQRQNCSSSQTPFKTWPTGLRATVSAYLTPSHITPGHLHGCHNHLVSAPKLLIIPDAMKSWPHRHQGDGCTLYISLTTSTQTSYGTEGCLSGRFLGNAGHSSLEVNPPAQSAGRRWCKPCSQAVVTLQPRGSVG